MSSLASPPLRQAKKTAARWLKQSLARYAPKLRSTRHLKAHLQYPRLSFDEALIRTTFKHYFGQEIDLENPRTLAEKLNWLKLHDRWPVLYKVADK